MSHSYSSWKAKDWPHAVELEPVSVERPSHAMADAKEEEPEERECRICRGEGEENNPLYVPCDCRGSIRYCHEDCLVRWLDHSGKDRCELCGVEFAFAPVYAEGAPDRFVSRFP